MTTGSREISICDRTGAGSTGREISICSQQSGDTPREIKICARDKCADPPELGITGTDAPVVGSQYSVPAEYPGVPPYSWSFDGGSIDSTGEVTAVTTLGGSINNGAIGSVTVTDACGQTASIEVRLPGGNWVEISECWDSVPNQVGIVQTIETDPVGRYKYKDQWAMGVADSCTTFEGASCEAHTTPTQYTPGLTCLSCKTWGSWTGTSTKKCMYMVQYAWTYEWKN